MLSEEVAFDESSRQQQQQEVKEKKEDEEDEEETLSAFPCLLFCGDDEALRLQASPLFERLCRVSLALVPWCRDPPPFKVAAPPFQQPNTPHSRSRAHELDQRLRLGALNLRGWPHDLWPLRWCDGTRWEIRVSWDTAEHNVIDRISDMAQELVRAEARSVNARLSIAAYWRANRALVKADAMEWNEGVVSAQTLRRSLFYLADGTCCNFRTSVARRVLLLAASHLKQQRGLRVLDPCAGWGDRMVAAMSLMRDASSSGGEPPPAVVVASYTGVDPNGALHPGYRRLQQALLPGGDVRMVQARFEQRDHADLNDALQSRGPFDVVFTSPPYFDRELYCASDDPYARDQSFQPGMTVHEWLRGFLFPLLDRATHNLRPGGLLVLSINDSWRQLEAEEEEEKDEAGAHPMDGPYGGEATASPSAENIPTVPPPRVERIQYTRTMLEYLHRQLNMRYVGMIPFQVVRNITPTPSSPPSSPPVEGEDADGGNKQGSGTADAVAQEDATEKRNSTQPLWVLQKPLLMQHDRRQQFINARHSGRGISRRQQPYSTSHRSRYGGRRNRYEDDGAAHDRRSSSTNDDEHRRQKKINATTVNSSRRW